jgi:hypothetical protein
MRNIPLIIGAQCTVDVQKMKDNGEDTIVCDEIEKYLQNPQNAIKINDIEEEVELGFQRNVYGQRYLYFDQKYISNKKGIEDKFPYELYKKLTENNLNISTSYRIYNGGGKGVYMQGVKKGDVKCYYNKKNFYFNIGCIFLSEEDLQQLFNTGKYVTPEREYKDDGDIKYEAKIVTEENFDQYNDKNWAYNSEW